jgi:hypothetical protein
MTPDKVLMLNLITTTYETKQEKKNPPRLKDSDSTARTSFERTIKGFYFNRSSKPGGGRNDLTLLCEMGFE